MKNVLFISDFCAADESVAKYAVSLAQSLNGKLVILYTFSSISNIATDAGRLEKKRSAGPQYIEPVPGTGAHLQPFKNVLDVIESPSPCVRRIIKNCQEDFCIQKLIKDEQISLVLVGACKCMDLTNFLFGKDINQIIDIAACPVLIAPSEASLQNVRNLYYVNDFKKSDWANIKILEKLARPLNAKISVLNVTGDTNNDKLKSQVPEYVNANTCHSSIAYYNLQENNAENAFNEVVKRRPMGILVMLHRKYHFFNQGFKTLLSKKIVESPDMPLLILPSGY